MQGGAGGGGGEVPPPPPLYLCQARRARCMVSLPGGFTGIFQTRMLSIVYLPTFQLNDSRTTRNYTDIYQRFNITTRNYTADIYRRRSAMAERFAISFVPQRVRRKNALEERGGLIHSRLLVTALLA